MPVAVEHRAAVGCLPPAVYSSSSTPHDFFLANLLFSALFSHRTLFTEKSAFSEHAEILLSGWSAKKDVFPIEDPTTTTQIQCGSGRVFYGENIFLSTPSR